MNAVLARWPARLAGWHDRLRRPAVNAKPAWLIDHDRRLADERTLQALADAPQGWLCDPAMLTIAGRALSTSQAQAQRRELVAAHARSVVNDWAQVTPTRCWAGSFATAWPDRRGPTPARRVTATERMLRALCAQTARMMRACGAQHAVRVDAAPHLGGMPARTSPTARRWNIAA